MLSVPHIESDLCYMGPAIDTTMLDFWWGLPWVLPACSGFLWFTSGVTPADLLTVRMSAEPFNPHTCTHTSIGGTKTRDRVYDTVCTLNIWAMSGSFCIWICVSTDAVLSSDVDANVVYERTQNSSIHVLLLIVLTDLTTSCKCHNKKSSKHNVQYIFVEAQNVQKQSFHKRTETAHSAHYLRYKRYQVLEGASYTYCMTQTFIPSIEFPPDSITTTLHYLRGGFVSQNIRSGSNDKAGWHA